MKEKKMDDELLKEFEWAKENIANEKISQPDPDELEKILERIDKEREK